MFHQVSRWILENDPSDEARRRILAGEPVGSGAGQSPADFFIAMKYGDAAARETIIGRLPTGGPRGSWPGSVSLPDGSKQL